MEVDSGAWQFGTMTASSYDQSISEPAHPPRQQSQGSHYQVQEGEWQQLLDDLGVSSDACSRDFQMYSPPSTTAGALPESTPIQSIEAVAPETPLQQNHTMMPYAGGCFSPTIVRMSHFEPMWPDTSTSAYSTSIPEHGQWQPSNQILHPPPQATYPMSLPAFDTAVYQPQPPHHLLASESPFLSEDSPFHDEMIEDDWGQAGGHTAYYDDISNDNLQDDLENSDPCYAQLLYRCLREAPEHTMTLKDLYEWVREHSQKAKDSKNRGWQNSVRHNLSMNAAFEKVQQGSSPGTKTGALWRLTPSALNNGVISTTRYRKDPKRKPERRSSPALKRQISGAKGGQATRNATRRQQALREARSLPHLQARQRYLRTHRQHGPVQSPLPFFSHQGTPQPYTRTTHSPESPYFIDAEEAVQPMPTSTPQTPPQMRMMYDTQPKAAISDFNFGHIDFTSGGLIGNHDDFAPDTPSLATEASYMSEEGMQSLMSHNASREATSFPVDC
ncbi:hypothetical protein KC323_g6659 [Hortaea werneckii]|uniref:Fork-head domain-containing protein n=1 Tax=Hortaea werneckii TaxID=91943 RepID=A0A3M7H9Q1_HORWE|nr:hypothetical protein KC323_g6659 [Hortaea werneckii]KAI7358897.1 hypothetical protein KC320_g829 [Hortaea werneckii]RMZ10079.1 hypothetical protein D0862_03377 [Hortaea werneckii]